MATPTLTFTGPGPEREGKGPRRPRLTPEERAAQRRANIKRVRKLGVSPVPSYINTLNTLGPRARGVGQQWLDESKRLNRERKFDELLGTGNSAYSPAQLALYTRKFGNADDARLYLDALAQAKSEKISEKWRGAQARGVTQAQFFPCRRKTAPYRAYRIDDEDAGDASSECVQRGRYYAPPKDDTSAFKVRSPRSKANANYLSALAKAGKPGISESKRDEILAAARLKCLVDGGQMVRTRDDGQTCRQLRRPVSAARYDTYGDDEDVNEYDLLSSPKAYSREQQWGSPRYQTTRQSLW